MTAFFDIPRDWFPLTVEIFEIDQDIDRADPVWRAVINSPGVLAVPGFGRQMRTRVRYGDGTVGVVPPMAEDVWV
jgi:hypothetical protein